MITGLLIAILVIVVLILYLVAWYVHQAYTEKKAIERLARDYSLHTTTSPDGYHFGVATGANIPDAPPTLGEQIRAKRLELGLTQTELGHAWGIADSTVSNIEQGKSPLANNVLMRKAIDDFLAHGLPETASK